MTKEILFKEQQRFKQWWIWIILIGINGLFFYGVYKQVFVGEHFGNRPMSNNGLLVATAFMFLFSILFINFRLDTMIKQDGIYVRFFPFHLKFKFYNWESVEKAYVREYNAISEFGGWGLRLGVFGNGNAFNISGDKGLQLQFKNNKKLLIGTNKPLELTETLTKIGEVKVE